jgi:DNA-binding Lrp family transcriptional regulator
MGEDRLAMSQKERDRLKVLNEANKGQITQKQASAQLGVSERQVRRLTARLKSEGDKAVIHRLRGRVSNRRIGDEIRQRALEELSQPECADFGPTFATEHLRKRHGIVVGRDTVRKWMSEANLWHPRRQKIEIIHQWRQRRSCPGELVQWDTSVHDWLEGRGERLYLIAMIDDATSRVTANFTRQDSGEENLRLLWRYLERFGRPVSFYTDKASLFEVNAKRTDPAGPDEQPAKTQITRALNELGIERISAHSPQAKGRIERFFETAQDRLVKELRLEGIDSLEAANRYLQDVFLPDWNQRFTVPPANATDAHRPLTKLHDLAASLSHVEMRTVASDYTFSLQAKRYQIARAAVCAGMKGEQVRVERRLDGTVAARFQGRYLELSVCGARELKRPAKPAAAVRKDHNRGGRSGWMRDYPLKLGSRSGTENIVTV